MKRRLLTVAALLLLLGLVASCTESPDKAGSGLLQHVPADTPYVFVTSRHLPDRLRNKLADHYAAQLAAQGQAFTRIREQIASSPDTAVMAENARQFFDVMEAIFSEFEGRDTADAVRQLGIEPVTRSVIYGIGVLPAMRVEIADAEKLNAMLDRVERRARLAVIRGELKGQAYRRIDLGKVDLLVSVDDRHAVAGLLADSLFERDLPLLLGQAAPADDLGSSGAIQQLISQHGFTGYGEGFIKLDALTATLLGRGSGRSAEVMQALGAQSVPVSPGCMTLVNRMVGGMPRMVMGVTAADENRLSARGVVETTPGVARYLQKLGAPVPGVGGPFDGLLAMGMGLDLPALRNAIEALLRQVIDAGAECEWVEPATLQAVIPQLNLALGPMTAGIKGFNLQLDDLQLDPETLQPTAVRAGLLAAVDDPRGVFALGAMFNPALAALEVPNDGSLVDLPRDLGIGQDMPPLKVAIGDKVLLLLAGADSAALSHPLLNAAVLSPSPLFAVDYGVYQLVQRFGEQLDRTALLLAERGEQAMADDLREQMDGFRLQAQMFERLRISVHATEKGLVIDQDMLLR